MKRILYIFGFVLCAIFFACNTTQTSTVGYDNLMFNLYEDYYTKYQFDSICSVDGLDNNLESWIMVTLKDDDTKENVSQYMFIKSLGEKESIYRVQKINDNLYKITKRVTE